MWGERKEKKKYPVILSTVSGIINLKKRKVNTILLFFTTYEFLYSFSMKRDQKK